MGDKEILANCPIRTEGGLTVRTVPKGTIDKLHRPASSVVQASVSVRPIHGCYIRDPYTGKKIRATAEYTSIGTAPFEEHRWYAPEDDEGKQKQMEKVLPESMSPGDPDQILSDPRPGGIGYTLCGRRGPEGKETMNGNRERKPGTGLGFTTLPKEEVELRRIGEAIREQNRE